MFYYEVLVTQAYTAQQSVFTYAHPQELQPFEYVIVPLQRTLVPAIVVKKVSKPSFATKAIERHSGFVMPQSQRSLLQFIRTFYMSTEAQALELFIPSFLQKVPSEVTMPTIPNKLPALPPLTVEQTAALSILRTSTANKPVLVHGETGSGKTRLFIERAYDILQAGKSVLVLSPEIALVPHLAQQFRSCFGDVVYEYHSAKTPTERAYVWRASIESTPKVIVGTRSALFLPIANLGLLVVDEAHEPAYKQEEGVRYHATRLASAYGHYTGAQVLLASATPLVSDVYRLQKLEAPIVRMHKSAIASDHDTQVVVVDMKQRDDFSKHPMLSHQLLHAVEAALQNKEQSLIYLNRRGTARAILCHACGWQAKCPTCDIALTYHHDAHQLRCHTCGFTQTVPLACPSCASTDIVFKSAGTKALEQWLQKRFPTANIARFDTDNNKSQSLAERHREVKSGQIDILIGTQMLVKGLDLPSLSVVGIVSADLSLAVPDYTAEERTYQLLSQAMGRVGRGHRSGTVILQTFNPNNLLIQQILAKKYDDFYTSQVQTRTTFHYPPLYDVALFWITKKSTKSALDAAQKVLQSIKKNHKNSEFFGPVVALHTKKRGFITAQIIVKSTSRTTLNSITESLPQGWQYDLDPVQLL